jgi:UDP:flavonoid glycosyltransferase YjiC (YdhE family)
VTIISLGAAFSQNLDFWKMCSDAFGSSHGTSLMAVGPGVDVCAFGDVPADRL